MDTLFDCVVAADLGGGIGKSNDLPWPKLRADLRFLREVTSTAAPGQRNAVLMGRRTWESVPAKMQPLPNRLNLVLSRQALTLPDGVLQASSLDAGLERARALADVDRLFVIGGAQVYAQAFAHPACRAIYLTRIHAVFPCDAFLPALPPHFRLQEVLGRHREHDLDFEIQRWAA